MATVASRRGHAVGVARVEPINHSCIIETQMRLPPHWSTLISWSLQGKCYNCRLCWERTLGGGGKWILSLTYGILNHSSFTGWTVPGLIKPLRWVVGVLKWICILNDLEVGECRHCTTYKTLLLIKRLSQKILFLWDNWVLTITKGINGTSRYLAKDWLHICILIFDWSLMLWR